MKRLASHEGWLQGLCVLVIGLAIGSLPGCRPQNGVKVSKGEKVKTEKSLVHIDDKRHIEVKVEAKVPPLFSGRCRCCDGRHNCVCAVGQCRCKCPPRRVKVEVNRERRSEGSQ